MHAATRRLAASTARRAVLRPSVSLQNRLVITGRTFATRQSREYNPEDDRTPRRKGVFAVTAISAATVLGIYIFGGRSGGKVHADAPSTSQKDPDTGIEFPETLELPGQPPLTLLGLGVRTVSFLGLRVYSVGFYASIDEKADIETAFAGLTPQQRVEQIIQTRACALRIVPTRSTSYTHLRDGFIRAIQGRVSSARLEGNLVPEEEDPVQTAIQDLKRLFPTTSFKKHHPLHVTLSAPDPKTKTRVLAFPELGRVDNSWVALQFFLAYFAGQGISPAMKKAVEDRLAASL